MDFGLFILASDLVRIKTVSLQYLLMVCLCAEGKVDAVTFATGSGGTLAGKGSSLYQLKYWYVQDSYLYTYCICMAVAL